MTDSLVFLALATLFGVGCLLIGWALRGERQKTRWWIDDTDEAGA